MLSLFAVALMFALIGVVLAFTTRAAQISPRDVAWLSGAGQTAPAEAAVYRRYLARHRCHRATGGLLGVAFACTAGLAWEHSVSLGVGDGAPWADIQWCGLAGVILGALSAESFRLNEPRSTVHLASLAARPELARADLVRWARALCGVSLVVGALVAATGSGVASLSVAVGGSLLLLGVEVTRRVIRGRRRPVMSDRATVVDLRLRMFAGRSAAHLALAVGSLTLAWSIAKAPELPVAPLLHVAAVLGLLISAVVQLMRAAPRPPRRWSSVAA